MNPKGDDRNQMPAVFDQLLAQLRKLAKRIGEQAVLRCLQLGLVMKSSATPWKVRLVILGCLTYVISPVDAIPDILPGIGYTDDLTALGSCFAACSGYVTEDIRRDAKQIYDRLATAARRFFR